MDDSNNPSPTTEFSPEVVNVRVTDSMKYSNTPTPRSNSVLNCLISAVVGRSERGVTIVKLQKHKEKGKAGLVMSHNKTFRSAPITLLGARWEDYVSNNCGRSHEVGDESLPICDEGTIVIKPNFCVELEKSAEGDEVSGNRIRLKKLEKKWWEIMKLEKKRKEMNL
ncbi:hypothetical protein AAHA92_06410 [Salvia divinorum]|uniref:TF-B3 domain-containing protein n=1 Tax=Salvia divinorum TaxID=28513 RepID=A0ABD1I5J4_SALDI